MEPGDEAAFKKAPEAVPPKQTKDLVERIKALARNSPGPDIGVGVSGGGMHLQGNRQDVSRPTPPRCGRSEGPSKSSDLNAQEPIAGSARILEASYSISDSREMNVNFADTVLYA